MLSETKIDSSSSSGENRECKRGKIKLEIHSDKICPNEVLCTRENQTENMLTELRTSSSTRIWINKKKNYMPNKKLQHEPATRNLKTVPYTRLDKFS